MAQEARLKLRMQKELKLLLNDPPHAASFPYLSSQSEISDLCSIDAQIEGPEETVYGKGIFKIKIQIPERYPLQPPIVTFATPIYHPNIDNGGRICLDILNLPPKASFVHSGAWQPSLNISTVLTSIRLLLSEPNPDDGLMCEASREYKYNKQAFEHKARSMTEKYAKAGAGESSCSKQCTETKADLTMVEVQGLDQEPNHGALELNPSRKRSQGISKKLPLESASSNKKIVADQKMPNHNTSLSVPITQMQSKRKRDKENDVLNEYNLNHEKINRKTSDHCEDKFDNKENVEPNYLSSLRQREASSVSSLSQACRNQHDQDEDDNSRNNSTKSSSKLHQSQRQPFGSMEPMQTYENVSANKKPEKLSSVGKKLLLGLKGSSHRPEASNKENVMPIHNLSHSKPQTLGKIGLGRKLSLLPSNQQLQQNQKQQLEELEEETSISENAVVLDSEESEGEGQTAPSRTRWPLAARERLGKWRV
ncbi:hypothetical protein V6N13_058130 [Hibiscus sabdariffa]|uniref:UBC core domain-containing protein n=1 Tax=Hibiscus sabdariffa TaxID=183260 RepID=A0ABR2GHR1_9ROSI